MNTIVLIRLDSPGVPPSATAHELFRGFSYVAPMLLLSDAGSLEQSPSDLQPQLGDQDSTSTVVEVNLAEKRPPGSSVLKVSKIDELMKVKMTNFCLTN